MDGDRVAKEEHVFPWKQEDGLLQFADEPPSSMHEQGFLALLDRFCRLETGLEEALRSERLAREGSFAELRELLAAERQAREIGSDSLQELVAKEIYTQKAEIKDRIREEMILDGRLNGKRHISPEDDKLGNDDKSGKVQELQTMQERIAELEAQLWQEQDSRKADVEELRRLLSSERHAGGDKLESMDNFKDLLEKEQEARDLHLSSVQDLLSLESEARHAHARELHAKLAAEGTARERLREELQVVIEDGLLQQHASLQEQVARLERLLAEADTQRAPCGGKGEPEPGVEDRLTKLEKRLGEELRELGEALGMAKLSQKEHADSVKEALDMEERARVQHLGSVQQLLTDESSARQVHIEMFKEHLAAERASRERQQAALAERLGRAESHARETAGRHAAELANRAEDLQAHALSLHESLQQQFARHRDEVHGHSCDLEAQARSFQENFQQQLLQHREELIGHGHELQVQLAAQLAGQQEEVQVALSSHREEALAHTARHDSRHDALCDRLAVLEGDQMAAGSPSVKSVQQLYEQHRQALHEHMQEHARDMMEQLEGHRNEIEAKHRSLEVCVAKEQNSRELYENLIGEQLRKEKMAREQQLESVVACIEQEREQHERRIASVHDTIRQERAHREAHHGSHQEELARERATLDRAREQLHELRAGESVSADGASVAARLLALERTLAGVSNLIHKDQAERGKELQRIWDVLDSQAHGHRKDASSPMPQRAARASPCPSPSAGQSGARERARSPVLMWNKVAGSPTVPRSGSHSAKPGGSPKVRRSSGSPGPAAEWPEVNRASMSSLAQRSSAALIEATAQTLGSSLTLPLTSRAGSDSWSTGHTSVPQPRTVPSSFASSFATVARASAGAGPGPPVVGPSPAWMQQSLGPRGGYGSLAMHGQGDQLYVSPMMHYGQDPDELCI